MFLDGSDSEQESNEGTGTSQKSQRRVRSKFLLNTSTVSDGHFVSHSQPVASSSGFLLLSKKKRSAGSRTRAVGKRTPRFPVSYSYEKVNGEKFFSATRQGLKLKVDANDDDVAHVVALALAEASQKGGSPQVSQTPNKRTPIRSGERRGAELELTSAKRGSEGDEDGFEGGSMENPLLWLSEMAKGLQVRELLLNDSASNMSTAVGLASSLLLPGDVIANRSESFSTLAHRVWMNSIKNVQRIYGLEEKFNLSQAERIKTEEGCSTLQGVARAAEEKAADLTARCGELELQLRTAQEQISKQEEENDAIRAQHETRLREVNTAHANALQTRNQANATELKKISEANVRHTQQRDEARQKLAALELEVGDREKASYDKGCEDSMAAYTKQFDEKFPQLADRIFTNYYRMALQYHEVPQGSPLWNTPLPSVMSAVETSQSTQVQTRAEDDQSDGEAEVVQPIREDPPSTDVPASDPVGAVNNEPYM